MGMFRVVSPSERIERRVRTARVVVFSLYFVQPSEGVERVPSFSYQASSKSSRARWRAAPRKLVKFAGEFGVEVARVGFWGVFVVVVVLAGDEEGIARLSLRLPSSASSSSSILPFFFLSTSLLMSRVMPWALVKNLRKFSRRVQSCWKVVSMSWFWRARFS